MANVTISLDSILHTLGFLNSKNKRWLAEHLIEQAARDDAEAAAVGQSDEEFFNDLFSTPYDNPMTAEEAKRFIRENRHSGITRQIKPLSDYTQQHVRRIKF